MNILQALKAWWFYRPRIMKCTMCGKVYFDIPPTSTVCSQRCYDDSIERERYLGLDDIPF